VRGSVKRLLDVMLAGTALVVLAPILGMVALAVWMTIGRPVLFRQTRPGLHERPFRLVKFRTMHDTVGADGAPRLDAERLTSLGRFLRAASLDELPEFWNVLRGDMSLVGPRPLLMEYLPLYSVHQARRHEVRPGITGWAQVNGRNATSWEDRFRNDTWYVENQSLWLDLRILALTVKVVFAREGISQPGHATIEYFRGSQNASSNL
jgi:sugar transferase EpsL